MRAASFDKLELVLLDVVIRLLQVLEVIQLGLLHRLIDQVANVLDLGGHARFGPCLRSVLHVLEEGQVQLGWLVIFEERVLLVGVR